MLQGLSLGGGTIKLEEILEVARFILMNLLEKKFLVPKMTFLMFNF